MSRLIPPEKPNCAETSNGLVTITWEYKGNMSQITHFTVFYKTADEQSWHELMTNGPVKELQINNLQPDTEYVFRVAPNINDRRGARSMISDIIRTKDEKYQKPPRQCQAGLPSQDSAALTDSDSMEDLEPETSYEFRVASNTDKGQSRLSEISNTIDTACKKLPRKPCKLKCSSPPKYNSLTLSWEVEGGMSVDIQDFTIFYKAVDNQYSVGDGLETKLKTENPQTWFTIHSLEPNTKYQICVEANTKDGQQHRSEFSEFFTTAELPIPPPGAPRLAPGQKPTQHTIPIVWEADTERFSLSHFVLAYKAALSEEWEEIEIPGSTCEYTLKGLREGTDYVLHVQAHSPTVSSASSEDSKIATEVRSAGQIAREELKKQSKFIKSSQSMAIYQAPLIVTKNEVAEKIQMLDLGKRSGLLKPEKIILVVGATGAGKSTLINGLLNYVIGVEWAEKFRFRLVQEAASFDSQHKSQTQSITIYTLHHQDTYRIPYTIKVIDTPGFGDTEGISKDKLITDCIRNLFSNKDYGIDHIDAIGFVAQSALARLTPTQKYIFDSILALFGKDIGDNIFLLLTFCDSQMPPVLASTREAKIPFKAFFKFNNSALFARNDTKDNEFDQLFWKMGAMSFQKFLGELGNVEGKSLLLTKEVLEERQRLEVYVEGIQKDIYNGLTKLDQYKVEIDVVRQHEADIEKNKNFTYTVDEHKMVKVDLEPGEHVTNCLTCNRTCHYPCRIPNDEDKAGCCAMDNSGNCRICSQNCIWNLHRNVPFRIEVEVVQVRKTADELKKRYETAKGEKTNAEKLTKQILDDFYNLEMKVLYMTNEIRRSLARLSEIALRPNPLSTVEYLEILIKSERSEAKPGFHARIDQLETVKAQALALSKMADKGYDPFGDYRESLKSAKTTNQRKPFDAVADEIKKICPSTVNNLFKKFKAKFR